MRDEDKTQEELIQELHELRERLSKASTSPVAQESHQEGEARMKSIFRAAPIGIGLTLNRVILDVNDRLCEITGYTREELLGRSGRILYPADEDYDYVGREKYRQMGEKGTGSVETRFMRKDGTIIDVLLSSTSLDPADLSLGVTFTVLDITERKRTERALRESEERLRLLGDNLPESAVYQYTHEPDGRVRFLYFSAGIEKLNGVRLEDVLANAGTLHRQISPEYYPKLVEAEARSSTTLSDFDMEVPMHLPTGEVRWMRLHSRPRRMPDGRVIWDGVQTDVTEQKRMEAALTESEELFRNLFEHHAAVKLILDPETGQILDANRAAEAYYGWPRERLKAMRISEINVLSPEALRGEIERVMMLERHCFEFQHGLADGSIRDVEVFSSRIQVKGKNLLHSIVHDITERKQAEEALRESEKQAREQALRLQAVLDAAPACIWTTFDRECQSITGNRAAIEFSRVPEGVNLSKTGPEPERLAHYRIFSEGRELAPEEMPIQRVAASGKALQDCPLEFLFDDGTKHVLLGNVVPFVNAEGEPEGAVAAFLDITERKQMEEELRRSRDELELRVRERTAELKAINRALTEYTVKLERLNDELQEFAFVASHDLQEPLRKIQTFGHMLSDKFQEALGNEGRDYLMRMTKSANRMSDLIRSLLDYSRIATRPNPFVPTPLDRVIADSLAELELILSKSGARIEIEDLPTIEADTVQLRQLFQNLISNAIRYGKASEPPLIRISGNAAFGMCRVLVQDNGIGFDEAYVDRIFKPFQQLHGTSAGYGGTGMGLAICRKIVERHGGAITAKSVPGQGSTFIVTLPMKQSEAKGA